MKCVVQIRFNAAKRLLHIKGPCNVLHGYCHTVEVAVESDKNANMVVDFYTLEAALQKWVDAHWEHNVLLHKDDTTLGSAIAENTGQTVFYCDEDPTCEYIATYVKQQVMPHLFPELHVAYVRVYDRDNAWVEA